jgi:transposase
MKKPAPASATDQNLIRLSVVATRYGIHAHTVRGWISQGKVNGYRLGPRIVLVEEAQIKAMLRPIPAAQPRALRIVS